MPVKATNRDGGELAAHCQEQLADLRRLAHELSAEEWETESLCTGWRVKDVYAHLLYGRLHGLPTMVAGILRHRGSMDRWGDAVSRKLATELSAPELLAAFDRETSRWPEGGIAGMESDTAKLADNVTHELDIRWPLRREREMPADRMIAALDASTRTNMWGNKKRLRGLRFDATDLGWTYGEGELVRGPAQALLLAVNGRRAAIDRVEGPGVAALDARLG